MNLRPKAEKRGAEHLSKDKMITFKRAKTFLMKKRLLKNHLKSKEGKIKAETILMLEWNPELFFDVSQFFPLRKRFVLLCLRFLLKTNLREKVIIFLIWWGNWLKIENFIARLSAEGIWSSKSFKTILLNDLLWMYLSDEVNLVNWRLIDVILTLQVNEMSFHSIFKLL